MRCCVVVPVRLRVSCDEQVAPFLDARWGRVKWLEKRRESGGDVCLWGDERWIHDFGVIVAEGEVERLLRWCLKKLMWRSKDEAAWRRP